MVADCLPKVFKDKRMKQKVLFLFRASPFAPVRGGKYLENELSDIRRHTPSRLPDGRLKRNKIKKPPLAVKKSPAVRRNKNSYLRRPNPFHSFILVRVTPTAKRNSYRVAILVGSHTQGSVLRPQPWAGETQLRQSCQGCAPSTMG